MPRKSTSLVERKSNTAKRPVEIPEELSAALAKNANARTAFESLPPSHQREHARYVAEAKQSETRTRRAAKTIDTLLQKQEH